MDLKYWNISDLSETNNNNKKKKKKQKKKQRTIIGVYILHSSVGKPFWMMFAVTII